MEISAGKLAEIVNGVVVGDPNATICAFAKIEDGQPGAISFLANPKYTHYIYDTRSTIVIVSRDFEPERPVSATMIKVDDPYATIAHLMAMVDSMTRPAKRGIEQPSYIAPGVELPDDVYVGAFAYIGEGAKIGSGAQIYPQAYIGDGASVGTNTIIYAGAKIYRQCRVGERCIIHSGAVIGADGFGFAPDGEAYTKIPQMGIVEIGDDVEIGANTTVDRATMGATHVRNGVKLDNLIQIAHNCDIGENTVMASQAGIAGSTKIGRHCMIGGQVGIVGHSTIGDRVEIGAQSGVSRSEESGQRLMGSPATDFGTYARLQVMLKRLPNLFNDVEMLKNRPDKMINKKTQHK